MALSAAEKTLLYELLGIPQTGTGLVSYRMVSPSGAYTEIYSFTELTTELDTRLATMASDGTGREARVQALLAIYSTISNDPLTVNKTSSGVEGSIVDRPAQVQRLREAIGVIVGIAVPTGGFSAEVAAGAGAGAGSGGGRIER